MNSKPLVSVVLPVRNGMPLLPEAVESICSQTWPNWELIVVDDHSTDGTAAYLSQLTDPRIRVIQNTGEGFDAARATGIQAALGEFVARMDADDISTPDRFEVQVDFLANHPDFVGVGAQVDFFAGETLIPAFPYPPEPSRILANLRNGRVTICDSALMARTKAVRNLGPRMPGPGADIDFYLRLAAYGKLGNLPHRFIRMHIVKSSMSFSKVDQQLSGIAFALACDRARRAQMPEPTFAEFQHAWQNRPVWRRMLTKSRAWHQKLYRYAIMRRGAGRRVEALACLSASAILWPPTVFYQLKNVLRRSDPQPYEVKDARSAYLR